jgi:hypothetical protein
MLLQEQTENIIKKGYRICANQGLHAYAASKKVSRGIQNSKTVYSLWAKVGTSIEAQRNALRLEIGDTPWSGGRTRTPGQHSGDRILSHLYPSTTSCADTYAVSRKYLLCLGNSQ